MTWLFILYTIGAMATYVICKMLRGKSHNDLEDVVMTFSLSLLSLAGLLFIGVVAIIYIIKEERTNHIP